MNQEYRERPATVPPTDSEDLANLNMLSPEQIRLVDRLLTELGPFGEIRLIKAKGKVRFVQTLSSASAM